MINDVALSAGVEEVDVSQRLVQFSSRSLYVQSSPQNHRYISPPVYRGATDAACCISQTTPPVMHDQLLCSCDVTECNM